MAARTPLIVGNWKMHKTIAATRATLAQLREALDWIKGVEVGVAPPFTALAAAAEALAGSPITLAAQNLHAEEEGAFTGEISAPMLAEIGVRYVIVGHSERRALFGEDDAFIRRKLEAALAHGLRPILCVGETWQQRQAGETAAVVTGQLRGGLEGLGAPGAEAVAVAYEPVWAIGTGATATPEQAQEVHALIRECLADLLGPDAAAAARIQYGGSVKPENAAALAAQPDIDGVLVGGASLEAASFAAIVRAAAPCG